MDIIEPNLMDFIAELLLSLKMSHVKDSQHLSIEYSTTKKKKEKNAQSGAKYHKPFIINSQHDLNESRSACNGGMVRLLI